MERPRATVTAWESYIGGYPTAQKWLKYRKARALGFEDILHYRKMILALVETRRVMEEVDLLEFDSIRHKNGEKSNSVYRIISILSLYRA